MRALSRLYKSHAGTVLLCLTYLSVAQGYCALYFVHAHVDAAVSVDWKRSTPDGSCVTLSLLPWCVHSVCARSRPSPPSQTHAGTSKHLRRITHSHANTTHRCTHKNTCALQTFTHTRARTQASKQAHTHTHTQTSKQTHTRARATYQCTHAHTHTHTLAHTRGLIESQRQTKGCVLICPADAIVGVSLFGGADPDDFGAFDRLRLIMLSQNEVYVNIFAS